MGLTPAACAERRPVGFFRSRADVDELEVVWGQSDVDWRAHGEHFDLELSTELACDFTEVPLEVREVRAFRQADKYHTRADVVVLELDSVFRRRVNPEARWAVLIRGGQHVDGAHDEKGAPAVQVVEANTETI